MAWLFLNEGQCLLKKKKRGSQVLQSEITKLASYWKIFCHLIPRPLEKVFRQDSKENTSLNEFLNMSHLIYFLSGQATIRRILTTITKGAQKMKMEKFSHFWTKLNCTCRQVSKNSWKTNHTGCDQATTLERWLPRQNKRRWSLKESVWCKRRRT